MDSLSDDLLSLFTSRLDDEELIKLGCSSLSSQIARYLHSNSWWKMRLLHLTDLNPSVLTLPISLQHIERDLDWQVLYRSVEYDITYERWYEGVELEDVHPMFILVAFRLGHSPPSYMFEVACSYDRVQIMELLVWLSPELVLWSEIDYIGEAIEHNAVEAALWLLRDGRAVFPDMTWAMQTCEKVEIMQALLRDERCVLHDTDNQDENELVLAIVHGIRDSREMMVRALLEDGRLDPMVGDGLPLRLAIEEGHIGCVRALLSDPRMASIASCLPAQCLILAVDSYQDTMLQYLLTLPHENPTSAVNTYLEKEVREPHLSYGHIQTALSIPDVDHIDQSVLDLALKADDNAGKLARLIFRDRRLHVDLDLYMTELSTLYMHVTRFELIPSDDLLKRLVLMCLKFQNRDQTLQWLYSRETNETLTRQARLVAEKAESWPAKCDSNFIVWIGFFLIMAGADHSDVASFLRSQKKGGTLGYQLLFGPGSDIASVFEGASLD